MTTEQQWERIDGVLAQCGAIHSPREFCITALTSLRQVFPYDAATVFFLSADGRLVDEYFIGVSRTIARDYNEHYLVASEGAYSVERIARDYTIMTRHDNAQRYEPVVMDWEQEPHDTTFYREYVHRQKVRWATGFCLCDNAGKIRALFDLERFAQSTPPSAEELDALSRCNHHLDSMYQNFYVTPPSDEQMGIQQVLDPAGHMGRRAGNVAGLTPRELEVGQELLRGNSPKAVSMELGISRATVYKHIDNMHRKPGVSNQVELIRKLRDITTRNKSQAQGRSTAPERRFPADTVSSIDQANGEVPQLDASQAQREATATHEQTEEPVRLANDDAAQQLLERLLRRYEAK